MSDKKQKLGFKVHTASLFNEVLNNPSTWQLTIPFRVLGDLLHKVGERASELNDPELNALMCRLAIYEVSDPYNPNYDESACLEVYRNAEQAKQARMNKPCKSKQR